MVLGPAVGLRLGDGVGDSDMVGMGVGDSDGIGVGSEVVGEIEVVGSS